MNGKPLPKDKQKKIKVKTIRQLIKELDKEVSEYVRKRDKGVCFTCGVQKHWKDMQCGHYESRQHLATRWDLRNLNCQCVGCNVFKHGNMPNYARAMIKKFDKGILDRLHKLTLQTVKLKADEMIDWIEYYKKENKKND